MFDIIKSIKGSASIIALKIIADKIIFLTNKYLMLIYDKLTFAIIYKKQLVDDEITRHLYDKTFSISSKLDFCLTPSKPASPYKFFLLKYIDSLKKNTSGHQPNSKSIYCSAFSHKSDILAIGTEDGKVFLYSLEDKSLLKSFLPRADYISNLTFSLDDNFLAISSFDKTNTIYSFKHGVDVFSYDTENVIERLTFVDNDSKLVAVDRKNKFMIVDLKEKNCKELAFEFDEWPTTIKSINKSYVLVGTKGKYLYIVDYIKESIAKRITFDNSGISSLEIDNGRLYVGFIDGEIKVIDMNSNLDAFVLNLKLNKLQEASDLMENNIFLMTQESVEKFDEVWPDILSKAKKLIVSGNMDEAQRIVSPFFFDQQKNDEFLLCLGDIEQYSIFVEHIANKRYIEAFKLADKYEFLKKDQEYEIIEKYFIRLLHDVKLLFFKGDEENVNQAKNAIRAYGGIPSKANIVNNLLQKYKVFLHAEKFIKERKFRQYFILVEQNKFLKEEEIYKRVLQIGNLTFEKLNNFEQEGSYEKALAVAEYLRDFLPFKADVEQRINKINRCLLLQKSISENNIKKVYESIEKDPSLELLPLFISFHKTFLDLKEGAHIAAKKGESKTVGIILKDYLNVKYTIHLVAQEYKLAYLTQIEEEMNESPNRVDWEEIFKLYISYFGLDYELSHLCEKYNLQDKLKNIKNPNNFNGYEDLSFVPSIFQE